MGHEDEGDAEAALQQLQLDLHLLAQLAIERAERFVQQQNARPIHEGSRHRHTLLLTTRHLSRFAIGQFGHLHHVEGLGHPRRDLRLGDALLPQSVGDVLTDRHVREERVVLEHRVHIALVRRNTLHVLTTDPNVSGIGLLEPGQHAQRGGLAATRRSEQRQELTGLNAQADRVDRNHAAEALGEVLQFDCAALTAHLACPPICEYL